MLDGGVANAGAVVREGAHVLRPANPHSETIHALLRHLRRAGFRGAPEPLGLEPGGRERLAFIDGQTTAPPWATGFLAMWELIGGEAYYEQQLEWYRRNRARFAEALR